VDPTLFFSALRARFGVFAVALGVTVVAATVISLLLPKSYRATVSLLVDTKDEQSLSNTLVLPQRDMRIAYIQTQVDIITSERVARRVVSDLDLAQNSVALAAFQKSTSNGVIGEWVHNLANDLRLREIFPLAAGSQKKEAESIDEWLVEKLLHEVKVETSQSSIIHVSFSWDDPAFAALVANGFAQAYLDTTLELRVQPTRNAVAWFDEQVKSLRANLEDAQAKLTDYQRREGIVATDERSDVEHARLAELSSQLVKAQAETFDWQSRAQQARAVLAQGTSPDRLPEINSNPQIQRLSADLLQGEAKLQELATQYGVNYPLYQRQLSENRSRREKLDAEMRKIVAGIENSKRQSLRREGELEAAVAAQRARLLDLTKNRNELAVLTRNVDTAQKTYDTVMQRFAVSQVESRASQANVAILNPAVAPRLPYRPKVGLNIALSVIVGTMLGLGIVILMEMSDRRVRSLVDLGHNPNVPVLGVLDAWKPSERLLLGGPSNSRLPPSTG